MAVFGLIGKNISYSFSKEFFSRKFERESLPHRYKNFDVSTPDKLAQLFKNKSEVAGFNVTIPYKEAVLDLLHKVDKEAKIIGAVNTIKRSKSGELIGYNTDHYGFAKALVSFFPLSNKNALILGTGGASKAIAYVFEAMEIDYTVVSRTPVGDQISYEQLSKHIIEQQGVIVNCTPLGTYPDVRLCPKIPYRYITKKQLLFDLVYNPEETEFLNRGKVQGARISNGRLMLEYQAQKSWTIWNS